MFSTVYAQGYPQDLWKKSGSQGDTNLP